MTHPVQLLQVYDGALREVCSGAEQLYDYMLANHCLKSDTVRYHDALMMFETDAAFVLKYEVWLEELRRARWIQRLGLRFILGYGVTQRRPFGHPKSFEEFVQLLLSRYLPRQRETVKAALELFGPLTDRQTVMELEYYARFSPNAVSNGLQVYLSLPDEKKKLGRRYARGVIRNEPEAQVDSSAPHSGSVSERVEIKPSQEFEAKKQKEEWIRSQIDQARFMSMCPEAQQVYIAQLESKYEQRTQSQ